MLQSGVMVPYAIQTVGFMTLIVTMLVCQLFAQQEQLFTAVRDVFQMHGLVTRRIGGHGMVVIPVVLLLTQIVAQLMPLDCIVINAVHQLLHVPNVWLDMDLNQYQEHVHHALEAHIQQMGPHPVKLYQIASYVIMSVVPAPNAMLVMQLPLVVHALLVLGILGVMVQCQHANLDHQIVRFLFIPLLTNAPNVLQDMGLIHQQEHAHHALSTTRHGVMEQQHVNHAQVELVGVDV